MNSLKNPEIAARATLQHVSNPILTDKQLLAVNAFGNNRTASEIDAEANLLGAQADVATKEGIALMFRSKEADFLEAALLNEKSKAMEECANSSALAGAAALFQDKDDSKKHREQAVLLNEQSQEMDLKSTEASADVAAQYLLSGLSTSLKQEAKSTKEAQNNEMGIEVTSLFWKGSLKTRFSAARKVGHEQAMELTAALMLQSAWRATQARKKALLLKQQRIRLLEEAYARKLQTAYRARIARKKVLFET